MNQSSKKQQNQAGLYLLSLFLGPLIILSCSVAKDFVYFLPVYTGLAVLVVLSIDRCWMNPGKASVILTWMTAVSIIAAAGFLLGWTVVLGGISLTLVAGLCVYLAASS